MRNIGKVYGYCQAYFQIQKDSGMHLANKSFNPAPATLTTNLSINVKSGLDQIDCNSCFANS